MAERQIKRGKEWLENLLHLMAIPAEVAVKQEKTGAGPCWLVIDETKLSPQQIEILLGKQGETLDGIQYLANAILNLGLEFEEQQAFTVELDGYRLRRQEELLAWTERVVEQVRQTGQEVEMSPLSSAERRQVHTFLQDVEDLVTESRGQEPNRRLVVRLR